MLTPSNAPLKPKSLVVYVEESEVKKLKTFSRKNGKTMSEIVRQAIRMRMSAEQTPYDAGFNHGLDTAIKIALTTKGCKMMFPSGKSFGQLIKSAIESFKRSGKYPEGDDDE
jgi:hypothetical protein